MCVVYSYLLGRRCVDERSDRSPQSAEEPAGVQDMDLADQLWVVGLVDRVDRLEAVDHPPVHVATPEACQVHDDDDLRQWLLSLCCLRLLLSSPPLVRFAGLQQLLAREDVPADEALLPTWRLLGVDQHP